MYLLPPQTGSAHGGTGSSKPSPARGGARRGVHRGSWAHVSLAVFRHGICTTRSFCSRHGPTAVSAASATAMAIRTRYRSIFCRSSDATATPFNPCCSGNGPRGSRVRRGVWSARRRGCRQRHGGGSVRSSCSAGVSGVVRVVLVACAASCSLGPTARFSSRKGHLCPLVHVFVLVELELERHLQV